MNIGTFAMPLHPASRPLVDVLKENAEKIILADQLGFAEAWIGEHFSAATEPLCFWLHCCHAPNRSNWPLE